MQLTTTLAAILSFVSQSHIFAAARSCPGRPKCPNGVGANEIPILDPSTATQQYFGGPVLSNVEVVTIYWGGRRMVRYADQLDHFYAGITNSVYMDWLSEYSTPTQTIGRGSLCSTYSYDNAPVGTIDGAIIRNQLKNLITNGKVLPPNANTYYAIHFSPRVTVSGQCQLFCAYHDTIRVPPLNISYGVLPDRSSCNADCGGADTTAFDNLCSVASHLLIEAVVNPAVGVANIGEYPTGWYDITNGEIGDICYDQVGTVVGGNGLIYTVQQGFSNSTKSCIVSR